LEGQELAARHIALRERAGLTQEQEAKMAGVSPTTISGIESGKIARPHLKTLLKIARALGADAGELRESGKGQAPPSSTQPPLNGFEEERRATDEDARRQIYTGLAAERAALLESMAELWSTLLDRGGSNLDTLRQMQHVTLKEIINHAIDVEEIKEWCASEQRGQLERAEQRLLEADRQVSQAVEAQLQPSEIDRWRAAKEERQAQLEHKGISRLA
jgi:transcriptional regulator with XRE-family HTH domain